MALIVIDCDPERSLVRKKLSEKLQSIAHQRKPQRVFDAIVVVFER